MVTVTGKSVIGMVKVTQIESRSHRYGHTDTVTPIWSHGYGHTDMVTPIRASARKWIR